MAIAGQQNINIGLPNESTGSDSLYTAFNKVQNNFSTLFSTSSPFANINGGDGISVALDTGNNTATITNDGVINIIATNSISVSNDGNGNFTLSVISDGNGNIVAGVTSVGVIPASTSRLTVTGTNPVTSSGNLLIDLATTGVSSGTYTYPTITVDAYGRVTNIANANSVGTVTSVGLTPGTGIQITGGPVTTNGNITVTNTGVTSLNAGSGIVLSGSNGAVTISSPSVGGTVTSVGVSSASLTVSGSPIITAGVITIEIPNDLVINNSLTSLGNVFIGSPARITMNATNGEIFSNGIINSNGVALLYPNGLITGANIASSGTLYAGNDLIIAGNSNVDGLATFNGGVLLNNDGNGASINWEDDQAPENDTSIAYNNSTNALVITVNNSGVMEIYDNQVTIQEPLNLAGPISLTNTASITGNVLFGGNINVSSSTINIANANATTINFGGAASEIAIGAPSGSNTRIKGNLYVQSNVITERLYGNPDALDIYSLSGFTHVARSTSTSFKTYVNLEVGSPVQTTINANGLIYTNNEIFCDRLTTNGVFLGSNGLITANNISVVSNLFLGTFASVGSNLSVGSFANIQGNLQANSKIEFRGSDNLINGGAVSLSTFTTYFTTAGAETGTLAAGTAGQVKAFVMTGFAGNKVITVTNAGWGGAGTMTFSATGQGCTLVYQSNKWYCIGNNGVTFA